MNYNQWSVVCLSWKISYAGCTGVLFVIELPLVCYYTRCWIQVRVPDDWVLPEMMAAEVKTEAEGGVIQWVLFL